MKQNINIEAEGSELILRNKAGDHVIIPKKYRTEVQGMIKDGCHGCIDALVETLPVMADYAGDGSLLPNWNKVKSTINPKNWGVSDYSQYKTRGEAYAAARKAGKKEFMWNNQRFSTIEKNLPGERIIQRDDFVGSRFINTIKKDSKPNLTFSPWSTAWGNVKNYYTGKPLEAGDYDLRVSKYRPDDETDPTSKYISIQNDAFKDAILYYTNNYYQETGKANRPSYSLKPPYNIRKSKKNIYDGDGNVVFRANFLQGSDPKLEDKNLKPFNVLGNFKLKKGEDERGHYVQYYDVWNRSQSDTPNLNKTEYMGLAKPFEVYDRIYYKDYGDGKQKRMYYTDKELSELDINKKNFDTLALQRELSNRGYKLPKSTKKDRTFDGIWGDETKNALLDYQTKNKKK